MFRCVTQRERHEKGNKIKQQSVKLIPMHHCHALNHFDNRKNSLCKNAILSLSLPFYCTLRQIQTQTPKESWYKPTCHFYPGYSTLQGPLTKPIFSLRLPIWHTANTLTHSLTEQMCNVTTSHSSATALYFLCRCLGWKWWWIYFSIQVSSSTVKSITLYKADTESLFHSRAVTPLSNLYQRNTKRKVMFYASSLVNM